MASDDGFEFATGLRDGAVLDVVIVDAETVAGGCVIEVAVATGPHRGELLAIRSPGLDLEPVDLLGLAATVTIVDGQPRLSL